ncbi:hypothetical protein G6F57_011594 [Rhizopus arrhizus]|uniref:Uncharacterized protein n=1 Tax=Rhizopus oryzae TaxID=64495 RepID=A0A9P7BUU4_RHIOR|nr:hypothetical protein G6F23_009057 [Rhizopus arrhizus]KAG0936384.1 hypothetical protein G6F30_008845 [Rhizopus arrhizus]KAG0982099.1 hypothetical protein G6F29_006559 [Rhizopus arrhizus]KAG1020727.1 hypothetical protein G6F26_009048 [Rhizopus arrhizus]KAG1035415.1 hypothetical protein G6F25_008857 [Rhizopus arrhizus]
MTSTDPVTTTTTIDNNNNTFTTNETTEVPTTDVTAETVPSPAPVNGTTQVTPSEELQTATPQPTPSKSNPTKRLSLFIEKAIHIMDKKSFDKKVAPKSPEPVESSPATDNVAEESQETAAPAEVTEPVADSETKNKNEKRMSILGSLFRNKVPTKESETTEVPPPVPTKESSETTHQEPGPASTEEHDEQEAVPPVESTTAEPAEASAHKEHKDNVIEQIKRSSIGKFFNKKKGHATEAPKEETVDHNEVPTTTDKPADTPTEQPLEPKSTSRPSSPLGRSLTQLFRRKKTPATTTTATTTTTEEQAKEEQDTQHEPIISAPSVTPATTVRVN